jgi:hypothetical protein
VKSQPTAGHVQRYFCKQTNFLEHKEGLVGVGVEGVPTRSKTLALIDRKHANGNPNYFQLYAVLFLAVSKTNRFRLGLYEMRIFRMFVLCRNVLFPTKKHYGGVLRLIFVDTHMERL